MFELHPTLAKDSLLVGEFELCQCRLVNNMQFPWLLLIPKKNNIKEIFELDLDDQQQLMRESSALSQALHSHFTADKLNVAALGNQVPQLHLHHIVRYQSDAAWPNPIWGGAAAGYTDDALNTMRKALHKALNEKLTVKFTWQMG